MTKNYQGILFFGQSIETAGRGIAGFRLRTAAATAGFDVLIIDYVSELSKEQILSLIDKHNTGSLKFVGFSTSWIDGIDATAKKTFFPWYNKEFFKSVKDKFSNLLIISGGHDLVRKTSLLEYSDYHFHGFSDNTFVEFLKMINNQPHNIQLDSNEAFNGKFIDSNKTNPVNNPDDIETVFEKEDGFLPFQPVPIEISRGCIFRCSFCRHPFQGKKEYDSYQRTPASIARELARNYELFGTTRYTIMDDTFNDSIEKIDRLKQAIEIAKLPDFKFVAYIRPEMLVTKPEMIKMLLDMGLKGTFFGIESFKPSARKTIGKGLDIQRVLDMSHILNEGGAFIHASFIVGLPTESPDDILKTQEYLKSDSSAFRSWVWQPLGIRNDGIEDGQSIFDKYYEDYGYTIPPHSNKWTNEFFTRDSSVELSNQLNADSYGHMKYAGWQVAGAWHLGKTDDMVKNGILDTPTFYKELKAMSTVRAQTAINSLLDN